MHYGQLPLAFEANQGQTDSRVRFISRGNGYTLFLTDNAAVLNLRKAPALRMNLIGASRSPQLSGVEELAGKSNYFLGSDPGKWRTNVPTYAKVRYHNTYPGVDLIYYGSQQQLEYDFVVAPGADPRLITLDFPGSRITLSDGDLVVPAASGDVRFHRPRIYQGDSRTAIAGRWVLQGRSRAGFKIAAYDVTKSLVIDPVLSYSTYLAGSGNDDAQAIAVNSAGNAYVTGAAGSVDFPTLNPLQPTNHLDTDVFLTELNPSGSALVYSTYLGGGSYESAFGIAVDAAGNAYVAGNTSSKDFPTTPGAFQRACGGGCPQGTSDSFVVKVNPTGSALVYSTYLGGRGSERFLQGIAVDGAGDAFITGWTNSTDFPTTSGAFQTALRGSTAAFVTELNPTGSALVYSTYLSGTGSDLGAGLALDVSGNAYVSGYTTSADFPTTAGAFQITSHGGFDGFITKLNPTGSALVYSTYLGGSGTENLLSIALDSSANAYVTGLTCSSDYPTTPGAFQTAYRSGSCTTWGGSAFVTEINASGSGLIYSTLLGGTGTEVAFGIALDSANNAYVTGRSTSTDFPTTPGAFQSVYAGVTDVFLTELNPSGSSLVYSTYLGGSQAEAAYVIALDSSGAAYVAGRTLSLPFPTTPGAFDVTCLKCSRTRAASHAFAAKFAPGDQVWPISLNFGNQSIGTGGAPQTATFTNSGSTAVNISGIGVTGANISDFSENTTCGTSLAAGASCSISVTFTPTAGGSRTAAVTITDDAVNSPQTVSLTGVGGAVILSPTSLTFPVQLIATASQPRTVTLINSGGAALGISGITTTGPFSQTNTCGTSVPAASNCTISVTFQPANKGTQPGVLSVTDSDAGSPQSATLTGTGTFISLSPASVLFGNQAVGTSSSPQAITVTNRGNAVVTISKISLGGSGGPSFSQTSTCGTTLGAGSNCTISVTFSPRVKGTLLASVLVGDSGGGSPQTASLSGTGN